MRPEERAAAMARIVELWTDASVEARATVDRAIPDLAAELDDLIAGGPDEAR